MTDDSERLVYSEGDFEGQSFHDSEIHGIALLPEAFEIAFDIDYISKWIYPRGSDNGYSLVQVPATLVFHNAYDVKFDLSIHDKLIVLDLTRESPTTPRNAAYIEKGIEWKWTLECTSGAISLKSVGYTLYYRSHPKLLEATTLEPGVQRHIDFFRGIA